MACVDTNAIAVIGFSAGGHLAANLATSASDEVIAAHGYDPDAVRPNGLMLAYPVITSGPLAHRGSFDSLLGERKGRPGSARIRVHREACRCQDAAGVRVAYRSRRLRTV